jgi:hypothetical protein
MRRHAVSIFRPLRMGGSRRRPQPILGPNTAARKAIPLLRPLPAGVAVYHASNHAIVSEHFQKKVKKSAGERDSPQNPIWVAAQRCHRLDLQDAGGTKQERDFARRSRRCTQMGKTAFTANRGNRVFSSLPLFPHVQPISEFGGGAAFLPCREGGDFRRTPILDSSVYLACDGLEESIRLSSCRER